MLQTVFKSPQMTKLVELACIAAKSSAPAFITGENGVGKEHIARILHDDALAQISPLLPSIVPLFPRHSGARHHAARESGSLSDFGECPILASGAGGIICGFRGHNTELLTKHPELMPAEDGIRQTGPGDGLSTPSGEAKMSGLGPVQEQFRRTEFIPFERIEIRSTTSKQEYGVLDPWLRRRRPVFQR